MSQLLKGFEAKLASATTKRYSLVLYFSPEKKDFVELVAKLKLKNPGVKFKLVNAEKASDKVTAHKISVLPTLLLLKNGREVDRLTEKTFSRTLLEQFFRQAAA